jgi:hypothetical protein
MREFVKSGCDVNAKLGNGGTALHMAAVYGKTEYVHRGYGVERREWRERQGESGRVGREEGIVQN